MSKAPWIAGSIAALVYLAATPAVTGPDDAGELTIALALCGVPHPTGYPLYVIVGHLFARALHAAGASWSHAANAWSAVGAAFAIVFHTALAERARISPPRRALDWAAPLAAVLLVGFSPAWFAAATVAEVYSWEFAWFAGAAWWALLGLRRLESGDRSHALAATWGLMVGIGAAHHATSLLLALPPTVALLAAASRARSLRASWLAAGIAAALLPAASYALVAWRAYHPAAYQWPLLEATPASVLEHVAGRVYLSYVTAFSPATAARTLTASGMLPLLLPGLAALTWLAGSDPEPARRRWLTALLAAALLQITWASIYAVSDPVIYLVPSLMVASLAIPLGASRLGRGGAALGLTALAASLVIAPARLGQIVERNRRLEAVEHRIELLWRSIPFQRGIVLWQDDHYTRLILFRELGRERPGIDVVNPALLTWPAPRAAFAKRWGFDPVAGLSLDSEADIPRISTSIIRLAPVPVMDFASFADLATTRPSH